ncbi:TPA_asm: queuine tRNA-ribosyltransferase [Caudoviricetes sp. vir519]|nr:TPA_asm: queuine tRNA-ribosyltransferase [Caudoviricetes sp. vir519]
MENELLKLDSRWKQCSHLYWILLGDDVKEFYYVVTQAGEKNTLAQLDGYLNIMINVLNLPRGARPPPNCKLFFVDSGGFSFFQRRFKDYPFSPGEYLQKIEKLKPDFFASMDIPCEPEIVQRLGTSVHHNIQKTIENQIKLLDVLDEISLESVMIPVIQGYELEDYLTCIDLMREQGLMTDYMAIGSICRRGPAGPMVKIIISIKRLLRIKLHAFGVKIPVLKNKACFDALYSTDSAAWHYEAQFRCERKDHIHRHIKDPKKRRLAVTRDWKARLDDIIAQHNRFFETQRRLEFEQI